MKRMKMTVVVVLGMFFTTLLIADGGESENLAKNGYKEIVLTGIHIGSYGTDTNDLSLFELIEYIHDIKGIERIRVGSLEQNIIDDRFIRIAPKLTKLCPHFHLSLQSGSDSVLMRMNRKYISSEYFNKVMIIRKIYRNAGITTDIIVGFPGETDEEFRETKEFIKKVGFSDVHIFKYSVRNGTKAAMMQNHISEEIKRFRSEELIHLVDFMRQDYYSKFLNKEKYVLFEAKEKNNWVGHTSNYLKVKVESNDILSNQIVKVKLINPFNDYISAIIVLGSCEMQKE